MSKFNGRALTSELRKLATEAVTVENDGTPVTREQLLAKMIWEGALGGKEEFIDEDGNRKVRQRNPVAWMQQFLFERIEGKATPVQPDNEGGMKSAEKVRQLAKDRLNSMARKAIALVKPGPPSYKPK